MRHRLLQALEGAVLELGVLALGAGQLLRQDAQILGIRGIDPATMSPVL